MGEFGTAPSRQLPAVVQPPPAGPTQPRASSVAGTKSSTRSGVPVAPVNAVFSCAYTESTPLSSSRSASTRGSLT